MEQRWLARWKVQGDRWREFRFVSLDKLMIARIDFRLKLVCETGEQAPENYELREVGEPYDIRKGVLL